MSVLVIGHKGFIGSYVLEEFRKRGKLAEGIDRPHINLTDFHSCANIFNEYNPDIIVNCAALSNTKACMASPVCAFDTNALGVVNLLELCRWYNRKLVYLSSISTYGDFGNFILDEWFPLKPEDIYGTSKACGDLMVQAYGRQYGVKAVIIRTSAVYGLGDPHHRLVRNFVENAVNGVPLKVEGNGLAERDFTHVKDLAEGIAVASLCDSAVGNIFNMTGGRNYSINDLVGIIQKYVPNLQVDYVGERKINPKRGEVSIAKARQILNYAPKYDLDRGIKEMVDYWKEYEEAMEGMPND